MSEKKIRRLAAIMFTDIAGYTRLMQESEARADQIRNRHREVFDYFHRQFNGQILQYYGDGTLSIFDSCVDAVQCAIAMQRELQGEPAVPLRIGIHLGDIVRSESDIYGDGVNVAARVESLGLPGAVMISGDIRKQINNQEIEAVSMGHFEMKNVATPIEVFAIKALGLVLPKAEELQGKAKRLEPIPSSLFQTGRWIRFAVPGIAVIALAATLLWSLIGGGNKQDQLLPESVREEKVAVAILNNHTGDESLDVLGFLMSEWLSSSLREIGIKTVSSDMVRQYQNYVNILPNDPEGRPAFSDLTGARYILEGSYYLFGQNQDSIRLFTRLNSAETGEQIQGFPTIVGEKQDKERLVEEIRQRLLGFWAMRKDFQLPSAKPPKYEAYQAFLKCRPPEFPCYRQAVALDSSFMLARVFLLQAAAVFDQDSIYRANESYIRRNWETCTTYEKNYFRYITAEQQLDFEAAFEAIEANYQMDPKDILMINESAVKAWWLLNRPNICLERFGNLFDQIDKFKDQIWPRNFAHYLQVLNHFGRHQEVIDFVNAFNRTYLFEKVGGTINYQMQIAYISLKKIEDAIAFEEAWYRHNNRETLGYEYFSTAAQIYATAFPGEEGNPFVPTLRTLIDDLPASEELNYQDFWWLGFGSSHPARVHYLLRNWDEAERIVMKMRRFEWKEILSQYKVNEHFPVSTIGVNQTKMEVEGFLGCIYARQGKRKEAFAQIQVLEQLMTEGPSTRNIFLFGTAPYLQAQIYAILGEKELAVNSIREAIKAGIMQDFIKFNLNLVNLRGYEPYEELIRPKFPLVKG